MFRDNIITNFLLILTVRNNFENCSIFDEVIRRQNYAKFVRYKNCAILCHPVCPHLVANKLHSKLISAATKKNQSCAELC